MVETEIYKAPESRVEAQDEVVMSPVDKPWPRILIAIWMFFTFGIVANGFGSVIGLILGLNEKDSKIFAVGFFVVELVLIYGIVNLRKNHTVATVVIAGLLGAFQLYNAVIQILFVENGVQIGLTILGVFVVPSFLSVWYLSRKSYRHLCTRNESYIKYDVMRKYALKAMRK